MCPGWFGDALLWGNIGSIKYNIFFAREEVTMQTRYFYMIQWGIEFLLFSGVFYMSLKILKMFIKDIVIRIDKKEAAVLPIAEMISGIVLAVIVGIRCNCGSDYYNYYWQSVNQRNFFDSFQQIITSRLQFGLSFLIRVSGEFLKDEYAFFMIIAFITIIPTFHLIVKRTKYPIVGIMTWILLGYLSMSINILKQAVAMTMVLCLYEKLYNRQYKRMIAYALLAVIFHTASLYILCVILLFRNWNFTKKQMLGLAFAGLVLMIGMKTIFSKVMIMLPYQYSKYLSIFQNSDELDLKLFLGGVLTSVFYVMIIWELLGKTDAFDDYSRPLIAIMVMCVPILLLGLRIYLFNRIAYFGLQFIVYLLPGYIKSFKKNKQRVIYTILVLYCFMFMVLCAENNYYAYSTIYNDEPMSVSAYVRRYQSN